MASPQNLLRPSSRILVLFLLLQSSVNGDPLQRLDDPKSCPPPFTCVDGLTVRYPFWRQNAPSFNHSSSSCGYRGFNISCDDDDDTAVRTPTLYLSDTLLHVRRIDYRNRTVTLAYGIQPAESTCPLPPLHGVTVPVASPYSYGRGTRFLRFFLNCSLYPPSPRPIDCLAWGERRSYLFAADDVPEFDWPGYCESASTVPARSAGDGAGASVVVDYGKALRDGFELTWHVDGECGTCEDSGGLCGFSYGGDVRRKSFFCICSDGRRRRSGGCHGDLVPTKLFKYEPNFVATGALISGVLVMATAIFYLLQQKKATIYRPISTGSHKLQEA
ncbi:LEAF RUST 10 DISEASE-RESISTANCE LOCUS RECEPTOR-LIKE PROTEIN KINASE-like 2.1 [Rhodamnia argentea]|uniref:non-specific serine/threonine protein kinase n=1 Tax=Rhodamnia argentea TaxID=178133 RepID=A0A8B8PYV1_9MYRT|nr:LEAF RUST 10 DISEASE-RESISTANCE LOCUS RECEPTOR-LIKE PROTEIN KINASE-like 2.1 [Rhodamnia argentea]